MRTPILILPNGYGQLGYTIEVQRAIQAAWEGPVEIVRAPGQNGNPGVLSLESAQEALSLALRKNREQYGRTFVIAHCSSFIYLTELAPDHEIWSTISGVLVYSYLANPRAHSARFLRRVKEFGVKVGPKPDLSAGDRFTLAAVARVPVPFGVVHPATTMNRLRASEEDLAQLRTEAGAVFVWTPEHGYEIADESQPDVVRAVVDQYILPGISTILAKVTE